MMSQAMPTQTTECPEGSAWRLRLRRQCRPKALRDLRAVCSESALRVLAQHLPAALTGEEGVEKAPLHDGAFGPQGRTIGPSGSSSAVSVALRVDAHSTTRGAL